MQVVPYWPNTPDSVSPSSVNIYNADPIGSVKFTASGRNPYGFLVATGEAFAQTLYPDLFLAVQGNYANTTSPFSGEFNAANDYRIPNLCFGGNRFPLASDLFTITNSAINALTGANTVGGASSVLLTAANIPPHSHSGISQGAGAAASAGSYGNAANPGFTGGAILNATTNVQITAANSNPTAVNIMNPYMALYSIVRATAVVPESYQTGCVNIDSTNNRFWIRMTVNSFTTQTTVCTLQSGAFKPVDFINNIVSSINRVMVGQTMTLMNFTVNSQGRYVLKMNTQTGAAFTGTANYITITFDFRMVFGSTIPQAVLDKTADTMGFYTRGSTVFNVGILTTQRSYIAPPKAMKIYFGSVEDGSMNKLNLPNITNSF